MENTQRPTVGTIVHYYPYEHSIEASNSAKVVPAIVTAVWGNTCVNLKILTDGVHDTWRTSANLGEGPGNWNWISK